MRHVALAYEQLPLGEYVRPQAPVQAMWGDTPCLVWQPRQLGRPSLGGTRVHVAQTCMERRLHKRRGRARVTRRLGCVQPNKWGMDLAPHLRVAGSMAVRHNAHAPTEAATHMASLVRSG